MPDPAPGGRPPTQRIPAPIPPATRPPTQRIPVPAAPSAKPPTQKIPVVEPVPKAAVAPEPVPEAKAAPKTASRKSIPVVETAEAKPSLPDAAAAAATGAAPAGATARRKIPLQKKLTKKQKYIRLALIFSTPLLCLVMLALVLARVFSGAPPPKNVRLDAEQQWQKQIDKAREGQRKIEECFFLVQTKEGEVPADAKAKFDADLAEGRKILEEALGEMEKMRKDAGEGVSEWDRDIYPLQKNMMLARRLADDKDRKPIVEYPKRYKEVMDAIAKVQKEYAENKEKMTPEKQKEIVAAAEKACKEAQELAEQWGELLDKYAVANKTSERMDPEEEAVSKLSLAVGTTRKLLKELK